MNAITKISTKGQVVIPSDIRKELDLDIGSTVAVEKIDEFIVLKKVDIPDLKEEFKKLTKRGKEFAKKKGIKNEEDVIKLLKRG